MTECKHTMGFGGGGCRCIGCGKSDKEIYVERLKSEDSDTPSTMGAETFADPDSPLIRQLQFDMDSLYERCILQASSLPKAAMERELGNYEYRIKRYPQIFPAPPSLGMVRILHPEPEPKLVTNKCPWCDTSLGANSIHACSDGCRILELRYQERLSAGANDCPEERDSVRRWVNAKQVVVVCDTCKRTPPKRGYSRCLDCMAPPSRKPQTVSPPENRIVWSTATDES